MQTELAGAVRVILLLSLLLCATALLFITTAAVTKRPTSAGMPIFQVISIYMVCLLVRLSMALIMPGDRYIACDLRHSEY